MYQSSSIRGVLRIGTDRHSSGADGYEDGTGG